MGSSTPWTRPAAGEIERKITRMIPLAEKAGLADLAESLKTAAAEAARIADGRDPPISPDF